ncbi:MAG: alpha-amylase family glycosyl hydrolase, partial [Clostridia bacterium]|nr:alpha-amylase family glycosyl hydrolase [Clostridia bacterium]
VPTVNKSAQGYKDLLFAKDGVIEKWTKMGVKGWRLDVVDELPIDFTDELCAKIKSQGEDTLIIGEVWEDASTKVAYDLWRPYFMGGQLDGVMNYPFKEAILQYAKDGDKQSFIFAVENILENYPKESLDVNMNLIGSHDTARALTALGCTFVPESKQGRAEYLLSAEEYLTAVKRLKLAALLQFTLPGVPCIFYGDEAGMQGFEDPLNRGTYPWGRENQDLINYYTALGQLRKDYKELLKGETHFVRDEQKLIVERTDGNDILRVESFDGHAQIYFNGKEIFAI